MNKLIDAQALSGGILTTAGTWALAAASNVVSLDCTLGNNTAVLTIPIKGIDGESELHRKTKIDSIDVFLAIGVAALDANLTADLYKVAFTDQDTVPTVIPVATALDTTEVFYKAGVEDASPVEVGYWQINITPDDKLEVAEDAAYNIQVTINGAANTTVKLYGIRVNG